MAPVFSGFGMKVPVVKYCQISLNIAKYCSTQISIVFDKCDESESMPKVEFLLRRIECHIAKSVFVSSNQTSLNRFKTRVAESNFIRFSFRFVESNFFRWICFFINRHSLQRIGIRLSSCLSGLPFFNFCSIFPCSLFAI